MGNGKIFEESVLFDGKLSKRSEKVLTDSLFSYIVNRFSSQAQPKQIIECCKAALLLFPYLEVSPSDIGGIVSHNSIEYLHRFVSHSIFF